MAVLVTQLLEDLSRFHILDAAAIAELQGHAASANTTALARELLDRGLLTTFQANLLLQCRGQELLLGSYILMDKLGEGGMGAVFRARNWKLGRITAIKIIRKECLTSADAVRRFYREIRAAAMLEHPNVVRAYDADEVNGTHFFAMEYVEGIDLAKLVREHGPLPPRLACEYIRQAAVGLQHAHERGLVHRDIKPANLLLAPGKGGGTIKLLDLGLARLDAASDESASLTQVGMVMGTPDFMAPEQSISAKTVDVRGDLYSLGCSLYFLLTGKVPFPGTSLTEKLLKHQLEQPQPLELLRPETPSAVADVVYKLMAKKREDRFQTPTELAAALADVINNAAIFRQAPSPTRRNRPQPAADQSLMQTDPFWARIVADTVAEPSARPATAARRSWLIPVAAATALSLVVIAVTVFFIANRRPQPIADLKSAPPSKLPVVNPTAGPATVNLLALIDPARDVASGHWHFNATGELIGDSEDKARIRIPYKPPAEYDLRIEFTRTAGNDVVFQVLVGNGRQFGYNLGWANNTFAGFGLVNGKAERDGESHCCSQIGVVAKWPALPFTGPDPGQWRQGDSGR